MSPIQKAVEEKAGCPASHFEARVVTARWHKDAEPFSRLVETFILHGHPTSHRAFAWPTHEISRPGIEKEYTVTLSGPGINSADDALRTAEAKWVKDFLDDL